MHLKLNRYEEVEVFQWAKFLSVVRKKQTNKYIFSYLQMFILHTALYQRAQGCDFVNTGL